MRDTLLTSGRVTPQAPGRTPHSASLRASGTTQPRRRCGVPAPRTASHAARLRASGTTKRGACLRASGTTSREGGSE